MKAKPQKNYKVIPNLGLKGKDLSIRIRNGSIRVDGRGNIFSLDEDLDRINKMSRMEMNREYLENSKKIHEMSESINTDIKTLNDEKQKAKDRRIAELERDIAERNNTRTQNSGQTT